MNLYEKIIEHSIQNSHVSITDHLIEECSEFITELCHNRRNRPCNVIEEMADVLFQIDKYLFQHNLTHNDLRALSIDKTNIKFPGLLDELQ